MAQSALPATLPSSPAWELPPRLHTDDGRLRWVGVEIEFAGLDVDAACVLVRRLYGGRIEPINRRLFGGCHLTRDHWKSVRDAGFEIESSSTEMARGPKTHSVFYVGVARKPVSITGG